MTTVFNLRLRSRLPPCGQAVFELLKKFRVTENTACRQPLLTEVRTQVLRSVIRCRRKTGQGGISCKA